MIFSTQMKWNYFFQVPPDKKKTKAFKNEICSEGKISKECLITVLLCSNMLGEFEPPLVID